MIYDDLRLDSYIKDELKKRSYKWLVTGAAGFIGSNIVEALLTLNQTVVGLDNYSTGKEANLQAIKDNCSKEDWKKFDFVEGDITNFDTCMSSMSEVNYVLHQAALGSVPRSIENPLKTNEVNIGGFLNVIQAAQLNNIKRFIYAASSSSYGDHTALPKKEEIIGKPLSPYAVTKYVNELYAEVFQNHFDIPVIGLRYFNVFGMRQDPDGAYAAVIPKWVKSFLNNEEIYINGDGETTRDFSYISNVVQANLHAALSSDHQCTNQVYNIALGSQTSLNELFTQIKTILSSENINLHNKTPLYREHRSGDVKHSLADISKAKKLIKYRPNVSFSEGLEKYLQWYLEKEV